MNRRHHAQARRQRITCGVCDTWIVDGTHNPEVWIVFDSRAMQIARDGVMHAWASKANWQIEPWIARTDTLGAVLTVTAHHWSRGWGIDLNNHAWRTATTLIALDSSAETVVRAATALLPPDSQRDYA